MSDWWTKRIEPWTGPKTPCFYAKKGSFDDCGAYAGWLVHDKRGCLGVCDRHAEWRKTTSVIAGHSRDCPKAPR